MSDTQVPPVAPAPNPEAGVSNADFARLRTQADAFKVQADASKAAAEAEKTRADELAAKLEAIERAQLAEVDRLKLDVSDREKKLADLGTIRDEHGRFASTIERLYSAELAEVPEDKREAVLGLSAGGDWASRLEALRNARALIGVAPQSMGSVVNPGRPAASAGQAPEKVHPSQISWGEAFAANTKP